MKYINLFLASVLTGSALADISWSATVVSKGKKIDFKDSGLEFVPIPPKTHYNHHHRGGGNHTGKEEHHEVDKRAAISYSSNWCGISQKTPRSADPITNVFGLFQAPDLKERPGLAYPQLGAAWVGIDGGTCQSALVQAGIQTILNSNGGQSASAWWQWVPGSSYGISGFKVKAAEWVSVNITALTSNDVTIILTNESQAYSVTLVLNSGPTLCRQDVDWIYEQPGIGNSGKLYNFARFNNMWFEEAAATTAKGQHIGLSGANLIYLGSDANSATCAAVPYDNSNFFCQSRG